MGLFAPRAERLLGAAYIVLGNRDDAREAVQEGFLRCWRRRDELAALGNAEAWLFTVVLNTARDLRRRRTVRRAESLPAEDAMAPGTAFTDPVVAAERGELVALVRAAMVALPEGEREVFLLRQNGGLSSTEIAAALSLPVGTVKTRMRSALRRLREAVDPAAERDPR